MAELLHHLGWRLPHHLQGFINPWLAGFLPSTVSSFSGKGSSNCFVVRFFREIPASSPAFKLSSFSLDSESSDVLLCGFWFSRPQPTSKTFMFKNNLQWIAPLRLRISFHLGFQVPVWISHWKVRITFLGMPILLVANSLWSWVSGANGLKFPVLHKSSEPCGSSEKQI